MRDEMRPTLQKGQRDFVYKNTHYTFNFEKWDLLKAYSVIFCTQMGRELKKYT